MATKEEYKNQIKNIIAGMYADQLHHSWDEIVKESFTEVLQ